MRVLIAIEGGEIAERVAAAIAPWVDSAKAEVTFVTVLHPDEVHETVAHEYTHVLTPEGTAGGQRLAVHEPPPRAVEDRGQALTRVHGEFEEYQRELAARHLPGVPVAFSVEIADDTARGILGAAQRLQSELIVIGTHGRKGIGKMLFGSVATAVVRESPVPLLVVGPSVRAGEDTKTP